MNSTFIIQQSFFVIMLLCTFHTYSAATQVSLKEALREACALFELTKDSKIDAKSLAAIYRKKAKTFHPDRYQGQKAEAEELFKGLGKAYEMLSANIDDIPRVLNKESFFDTKSELFYSDIQVGQKIKDVAKIHSFSSGFVKNTIYWINAELLHSGEGRKWATKNLTPSMRLCADWLKVMGFARTNNWQEIAKCVQANPQLVHLHDGQADALSLALSAYEGAPDFQRDGMLKVQKVLKEQGAIARFPSYDGGIIGAGKHYWY